MSRATLELVYLVLQIIFTMVAIPAAIIAAFQLIEMKKQRMADMSWQLFEAYSSREMADARQTLNLIADNFATVDDYRKKYHDKPGDTQEKQQDRKVRERARFFHQAGLLVEKRLVDADLLFGLTGTGFEYDHNKLSIIVDSSRQADNDPSMYEYFDCLWEQYTNWKVKRKRV